MILPRFFIYTVITLFCVVVLFPICFMVVSPFWAEQTVSLDRVAGLFNSRQMSLALNSVTLAGGTAFFSLVIGMPFAFLCFKTDLRGRNLFGWIYIIPVLIPPYIHAIVWTHMSQFLRSTFILIFTVLLVWCLF